MKPIIRDKAYYDVISRLGNKSSPVLDECRDLLPDRDCNEPAMTRDIFIKHENFRQQRLDALVEIRSKK